jgi:hypothetical protein
MNYREMLDQFEYLDRRLSHLEHENKYLRERLARLEFSQVAPVKGPGFTPGTLPQFVTTPIWPEPPWTVTCDNQTGTLQ